MKTDVKKTLILLGVVSIFALSSWAIQTRNAEGWFNKEQLESCKKNGTFIQTNPDYPTYGTCVCNHGFVGYACEQVPPSKSN